MPTAKIFAPDWECVLTAEEDAFLMSNLAASIVAYRAAGVYEIILGTGMRIGPGAVGESTRQGLQHADRLRPAAHRGDGALRLPRQGRGLPAREGARGDGGDAVIPERRFFELLKAEKLFITGRSLCVYADDEVGGYLGNLDDEIGIEELLSTIEAETDAAEPAGPDPFDQLTGLFDQLTDLMIEIGRSGEALVEISSELTGGPVGDIAPDLAGAGEGMRALATRGLGLLSEAYLSAIGHESPAAIREALARLD